MRLGAREGLTESSKCFYLKRRDFEKIFIYVMYLHISWLARKGPDGAVYKM